LKSLCRPYYLGTCCEPGFTQSVPRSTGDHRSARRGDIDRNISEMGSHWFPRRCEAMVINYDYQAGRAKGCFLSVIRGIKALVDLSRPLTS
jgi:hypothetical protein